MSVFRKSVIATICFAVVAAVATVPGTAKATTASERNGCGGYSRYANGGAYFEQSVMRGGQFYPGVAKIKIYQKGSAANTRFCAIIRNETNKKLGMTIRIGTRKQGSTSNPVTWNTGSRHYYDAGTYAGYAGGVALTPSKGRCAAVYGTAVYGGKIYTRLLTYNMCN